MKNKLTLYLLIIICLSSIAVGSVIYLYAKTTTINIIKKVSSDAHNQLKNKFQTFNLLLKNNQKHIDEKIRTLLGDIGNKILFSSGKISDLQTSDIQKILQDFIIDICIINQSGVIIKSNNNSNEGNDIFGKLSNYKISELKQNIGKGKFFIDNLYVSKTNGKIYKNAWYCPRAFRYIVKITIDLKQYMASIYPISYYKYLYGDFFKESILNNIYVMDINLYYCSGGACFSVLDNTQLDLKNVKKINISNTGEFDFDSYRNSYRIFNLPENNTSLLTGNIITLIYFDFSPYKLFLKDIVKNTVLILCLIILIFFFIGSRFLNYYIINRILIINKGLKRIASGDYSKLIEIAGSDEIKEIANHINFMQTQVYAREDKLYEKQDDLKNLIEKQDAVLTTANFDLIQELINRKKIEEKLRESMESSENERKKLEEANKNIMDSIRYAKLIQFSLLPNMNNINSYLPNSFFIWLPKDVVGGDIFHLFPIEENLISLEDGRLAVEDGIIIALADCTGHGIPGAFMTMIVSSGLRRIIRDEGCLDPAEILERLNSIVKKTLNQDTGHALSDDGLDAAICFVKQKEKKIIFAGARLSLTYIYDHEIDVIKGDRHSIGYKKSDLNYIFTNYELDITQGMVFYLNSDGYVDQSGGSKGFPYGNKRFRKLLIDIHQKPFDIQKEILLQEFANYKGKHEKKDDVTVIGFSL